MMISRYEMIHHYTQINDEQALPIITRVSTINQQNTTIAKNTTAMLCCICSLPLCFDQFSLSS